MTRFLCQLYLTGGPFFNSLVSKVNLTNSLKFVTKKTSKRSDEYGKENNNHLYTTDKVMVLKKSALRTWFARNFHHFPNIILN